jgi:hypothetical protein
VYQSSVSLGPRCDKRESFGFQPCRFFQPKTGQPFLTNTCSAWIIVNFEAAASEAKGR